MDAILKIEAMPPLPEPEVLKQPEDGELIAAHEDENAPYCWAWMSHGYDTGMEPYFGADQVHRYARDYAAQTLASKEAEIADAALKHVSLFGELQNAMDELARLREGMLEGARRIETLKRDCGADPESPIAIQNSRYMGVSYFLRAASPSPPKQQETVTNWSVQIMENCKPRCLRLTIGVQSFDIDVDDEEEGRMEWFCDMLTKAMKNATSAPKQQPALGRGEGGGVPLTLAQIDLAVRNAQIAFCLDKFTSFEIALARKVEAAHGIKETS